MRYHEISIIWINLGDPPNWISWDLPHRSWMSSSSNWSVRLNSRDLSRMKEPWFLCPLQLQLLCKYIFILRKKKRSRTLPIFGYLIQNPALVNRKMPLYTLWLSNTVEKLPIDRWLKKWFIYWSKMEVFHSKMENDQRVFQMKKKKTMIFPNCSTKSA